MDTESRKTDVISRAHKELIKFMESLDKEFDGNVSQEESVNLTCYIGLGIIMSNLMICEDHKERAEMATILIGKCIEVIQNSVTSLDTMMPERPSGIILPH